MWRDDMSFLHKTDKTIDITGYQVFEVEWWKHSDWDRRARGPKVSVFPQTAGWVLNKKKISLDELSIKNCTHALTMRSFKEPACIQAWTQRLGTHQIKTETFAKIFMIKPSFATPRDQVTGLKLLHRNLYYVVCLSR